MKKKPSTTVSAGDRKLQSKMLSFAASLSQAKKELKIESSLERVRRLAMRMKKREDMLTICSTIAQQLLKMGVTGIRNVQTAIFYPEKGSYMNYEFYAKHHKTFITDTLYTDHKIAKAFAAKMMKGKGEFYITHIKGNKVKDWIAYQKTTNVFIDKFLYKASSLSYYWYSLGPVALGISTYHPLTKEGTGLFKRFLKVFELAYRRYLDIEKAEAQAREAQIQLALERVRARTLAMQNSDELAELVAAVFKELTQLGFTLTSCIIWIHEQTADTLWIASAEMNKPAQSYLVKPFYNEFFRSIIHAWKAKDPKWVYTLTGKEKKIFEKAFFRELPCLPGALINALKVPKRVVFSASFNRFGALEIVETEALTDEKFSILHRFGKVFDAGYTRFNDLKKAEAQAREAQIQLALERVRAKTMAMHHSDELTEVVKLLYREFDKLKISNESTDIEIGLIDEDTGIAKVWAHLYLSDGSISTFSFPFAHFDTINDEFKKWKSTPPGKRNELFITTEFSGKLWNKIKKLAHDVPELADMFESLIKGNIKKWVTHNAYFSHGLLTLQGTDHYSQETQEIQKRFARVFEQTYTRFLDLQKAEAQAREAQIEAALERVRSRAMAMHTSRELKDVASELRKQMGAMAQPELEVCAIHLYNESTDYFESWAAVPVLDERGKVIQVQVKFPKRGIKIVDEMMQQYHAGKKDYVLVNEGEKLLEWFDQLKEKVPEGYELIRQNLKATPPEETIAYWSMADFQGGSLVMTTYIPPNEEARHLLRRFANVFGMAYQRFADLQKAEAQAREAQIETALERIRSVSMAIRKSNELLDIIHTVFGEWKKLGLELYECNINLFDRAKKEWTNWGTGIGDAALPRSFLFPWFDNPVINQLYEDTLSGIPYHTYMLEGNALHQFLDGMFAKTDFKNAPEEYRKQLYSIPRIYLTHAFMQYGSMDIVGPESPPETIIDILKRFAKVFEQAYTRYLDVVQAEAQAREAQIETALEKVRSRSMGMQKSEELKEVIKIVYQQLIHLKINLDHAGFVVDYKPKGDWTFWIADERDIPAKITHPYFESVWAHQFDEAKEKGAEFFVTHLNFEEKNKFYEKLLSYVPELPQASKDFYLSCPALAATTALCNDVGLYIENFSGIPYTEEENKIVLRFGKVFQQTYTRFLDLQKAEAQAREGQIQLALERVRARTMAMQKSDELPETSHVLFEQMKELGEPVEQLTIGIIDEENNVVEISATLLGDTLKKVYRHSIDEPYMMNKFYKAWKKQQKTLVVELKGDELNAYNKYRNELTNSEMFPTNLGDEYRRNVYAAFFSKGMLALGANEPRPPQSLQLLERFASVFDLTYTRFLDLQKAEAQAREAQIELALERVRARTMAMHKSKELSEVSALLYKELQGLGITGFINCGYVEIDEPGNIQHAWMTNDDGSGVNAVRLPLTGDKVFDERYDAWKRNEKIFHQVIGGDLLKSHIEFGTQHYRKTEIDEMVRTRFLDPTIFYCSNFSHGYLHIVTDTLLSEEGQSLLVRFTRVFEMTYKRFLDLQKAEAQAREAEIELALERVRARTMAMHHSDELSECAELLFSELSKLGGSLWTSGFAILDDDEQGEGEFRTTDSEGKKEDVTFIPNRWDPTMDYLYDGWKQNEKYRSHDLGGEEIIQHYANMMALPKSGHVFKVVIDAGSKFPEWQQMHAAYFKQGYLLVISLNHYEIPELLIRFAKVFEQTYTRFLDLQKAEAQARESKIEAALEKVRSCSLAMHKSDELNEVVFILFEKLKELQIPVTAVGIATYIDGSKDMNSFVCGEVNDGLVINNYRLTYFKHKICEDFYNAREKQLDFFRGHYSKEEKNSFYEYLFEHTAELKYLPEDVKRMIFESPSFTISVIAVKYALFVINDFEGKNLSEDEVDIIKRFARVFDQAYTRFLDLQKAEAQAREAQIEAALERIRGKVTSMQESSELLDIVVSMRHEFVALGHQADYFWYMRWLPEKYEKAMTSGDGTRIGMVMTLPRHIHGDIKLVADWEKSDEASLIFPMDVDTAVEYVEKMITLGDFQQVDHNAPTLDDIRHIGGLTFVMARTTQGEIGYSLPGVVTNPPTEDVATLVRFAGVFDLAYRRFEDLKSAEARNREAQIELALERVRARTMAMQRSDELPEAANNLFLQVQALGIPAWSAGYCIWENEDRSSASLNMSSEGVLQKPFSLPSIGEGYNFYDAYKNGESFYVAELGGEALVKHYQFMRTLPVVGEVLDGIINAGFPLPTFQIFHIVYFTHGYLMFITYEAVPDAWDIFQRFGKVFEQTYTRFLDLKHKEIQAERLKEEKEKLEQTLGELQATQKQLIQSEKMASLGELTAGIAHEIQNPLNFVNNFSDVSNELLEEMKTELAKGNTEDALSIAEDVKQNLEKILHHGKRADGIVKGMLQHSRSSSGIKEPTDINALCDEYLRLAYHGLRAKDKTFNARFKTDFDSLLPKTNVMPQDIGRVILNLINNAFYVVSEKAKHNIHGYEPTVSVSTKRNDSRIEIYVKDNGNGIPESIKEKIFQPFFTTKPTGQGTGLGLSLSYDIVKAHGGELKVDTKEGEGSSFIIQLNI